ncbi:MAG: SusD/RagB family nutrient-binding outer membrane lipoprotein [Tannerella sp.]|jgi:hypothetical protein|nr:SusD/RagB family nutrient-binding outer membrane lipoprotein [Tannerella sp.]
MKKYAIYSLIGLWTAGAGLSSCDGLEDQNTNPNATTMVTSGMLATKLLMSVTRETYTMDDDMLAKDVLSSELLNDYIYNRLRRADFKSMTILNNVKGMVEFATNEEERNSYAALGHFVRVCKYFDMTMRAGDIPYSESMAGDEGIYYPEYDTQKEVFLGLLNELDEADRLFAAGTHFEGDIVYGGDPAKWRKAVNVLQLQLLINLYRKADDPDLQVRQRFQTITGSRPLFTSGSDNCQLVHSDRTGEKYPFYKEGNNSIHFFNSTSILVDTLKLWGDRRLFYYAKPTLVSEASGLSHTDWNAYCGVDPTLPFTEAQGVIVERNVSLLNERYSQLPAGEPTCLLTYAGMNFILAEAAVRGLLAGDAAAYYETGVRAAMKFTADHTPDDPMFHHDMKITDDYVDTYLQGAEVAFADRADRQIRQIILQKYVMNFLQVANQSFFEYRRTGVPAFPVNPASNLNEPSDRMPVRWMYPESEYTYNKENTDAAVARQFGEGDTNNGVMWILKE